MFSGQREFRAIALQSSPSDFDAILALLPKKAVWGQPTKMQSSTDTFSIYHAYYCTQTQFTASDSLSEVEVIRGRESYYKYDFYGIVWSTRRSSVFVLAVPFSQMATELFGIIDKRSRSPRKSYKRIDLQLAIESLRGGGRLSADVTARRVEFLVVGGDTVQSAVFSGSDVVSSETLKRLTASLHGISLIPRRVRIRYEHYPNKCSLEADAHGNFWLPVSKDGANLPKFERLFSVLEESQVLKDVITYPLLGGRSIDENE